MTGIKVVFGSNLTLRTIVGAPVGRQRLRIRKGQPALLFVKTDEGIYGNFLVDEGETWRWDGSLEFGRNVRFDPRPQSQIANPKSQIL